MSNISNRYFNSIINNYLEENNMENKNYCDVDINKRFECNNSNIASQFVDVDVFSINEETICKIW